MNKVFKVIWSEARSAYVVVSEIAKNHGSKSCSTKKLLTMLIATGVMTCASFDIVNTNIAYAYTKGEQQLTIKGTEYDSGSSVGEADVKTIFFIDSYWPSDGYPDAAGGNTSIHTWSGLAANDRDKMQWGATTWEGTNNISLGLFTKAGYELQPDPNSRTGYKLWNENVDSHGQPVNRQLGYAINENHQYNYATAFGVRSAAANEMATAWGWYSVASGQESTAFGHGTVAKEKAATAWGNQAIASGAYSTAFGDVVQLGRGKFDYVEANGYASTAFGAASKALGGASTAFGEQSSAEGYASTAFGITSKAVGSASTAFGIKNNASGGGATAWGNQAIASGNYSTAFGIKSNASGCAATAFGYEANASGAYSTAIGIRSKALAEGSFAVAGGIVGENAKRGIAIGQGANSTLEHGIALGTMSLTTRELGDTNAYGRGDSEGVAWISNQHAIAIGNDTGDEMVTRQLTGLAAGSADTDAVNVAQLKRAMENVNIKFEAGNGIVIETLKDDKGTTYTISTNIIGSETNTDTTTVTPSASGDDGTIGGDTGIIVPNPGINPLPNQPETDNNIQTGDPVKIETVTKPTNFAADEGDALAISPSETLGIKGDGKNITTKADGKNIQVTLNKDLDVNSVAANTFKAGDTTITDNGLTINNGPSVTKNGIDAGGKKITNVEAGVLSKTSMDAVNGSQLHETNINVANNSMRINKLGDRVNKVGAGAAALAALHPLDFDPDAKWDFAAGYGNYRGANAAAVGAYYRPNEDTMFSVGGTFGNGENMVNAGVSFKLGAGSSHVSTSRVAMAKEIKELRSELEAMKSAMLDANAGKKIDTSKLQLFPDVPQNHWAYEYVAQLAGNGMIEGYPDGNFAGDRPMTRYEFAAILYRAMTKGAVLSDKILSEFSHELEYFTVDTIAKDKAGNPTIQRVRTVKENKNK